MWCLTILDWNLPLVFGCEMKWQAKLQVTLLIVLILVVFPAPGRCCWWWTASVGPFRPVQVPNSWPQITTNRCSTDSIAASGPDTLQKNISYIGHFKISIWHDFVTHLIAPWLHYPRDPTEKHYCRWNIYQDRQELPVFSMIFYALLEFTSL